MQRQLAPIGGTPKLSSNDYAMMAPPFGCAPKFPSNNYATTAPPFGDTPKLSSNDSTMDPLRSEILNDFTSLSKGELSKKWYFAEGKPSMSENIFPAVEESVSRYVVDIAESELIAFYKRNVQVVCNISSATRELIRDYVSILVFYMRMPMKKDTVATTNVFRCASPI